MRRVAALLRSSGFDHAINLLLVASVVLMVIEPYLNHSTDRKVMKDVDSASAFSAGGVHRSLPLSRPLHTSHVPTMPPLPVILSFGRWPSSLSSLQRRSSHGSSLRSSHGQPTSHSLSGS